METEVLNVLINSCVVQSPSFCMTVQAHSIVFIIRYTAACSLPVLLVNRGNELPANIACFQLRRKKPLLKHQSGHVNLLLGHNWQTGMQ